MPCASNNTVRPAARSFGHRGLPDLCWTVLMLLLTVGPWTPAVRADVGVGGLFRDNLVIQAGTPFVIWGRSAVDERVEIDVSWGQPRQSLIGDPQGKWQTEFAPPPGAGPHQITIRGRNTITIKNVLCGEVWICAGQSNMAM